ncbi:argininosuccinate lyase [Inquilinus limosus]|uniref:argininosuccinate lyase n=1 Tax=Inquilinus limosus TaxID=171674 RepID=UPI000419C7B3|nr:argininosuccinate lyase [Inquilinus limosus]
MASPAPAEAAASKVTPRLSEPLAPEILELVFRPRIARELAFGTADLDDVNQAHLVMLAETGLIDAGRASALAAALLAIEAEGPAAIEQDPAREDGYFNYEAAIIRRTGAEIGGSLHLGRSRNDINATLDRLCARRLLLDLAAGTVALRRSLLARAAGFADTVMPGYTHLQPAQPITFGFYLTGVAEALARDTARLLGALPALDLCALGACAFAGTSVPIDRSLLARLLGFAGVLVHAQDAVTSRDYAFDLGGAALSLAGTWGRFAQDLYVWSTQEFALVVLPDRIAGTSSIMPQKKNPVAVEYLKASAGEVVGGLMASFAIIKGGHFSHAGDTGRASLAPLWPALRLAANALVVARVVAEAVEPAIEIMARRSTDGFTAATDIADLLVHDAGLSFRQAHHVAADLVRAALAEGVAPTALTAEHIARAGERVLGRCIAVDPQIAARALDPRRSVEARRSLGAASPAETRRMIAAGLKAVESDAERIRERRDTIEAARAELKRRVRRLAGAP